MDTNWDLPSLRATIRLGGQSHSRLNAVQCYDVEFYPYTPPGLDPVFAVCGGPYVVVARCLPDKSGAVEILRWFQDDEYTADKQQTNYNSVVWSQAENGDPLLCVAGSPRIKVLNVRTGKLVATLIGHGDDINDLAISPTDPTVLASGSVDHGLRIWSLDPAHEKQPLAAICYGQGHRDQILTIAYHPKGRYILSAGMDTRISLWTVPDHLKEHAGTDKPIMVHYPHFSTTEIHTDFVDCVQWYNDLILSHACRENKIILWSIDNFNSDRTTTPPAPIPTSNAIHSRTPVTIPAHSTSSTRSAWGGRFQRLLQFELPDTNEFYIRFSLFHELGRHPILVAGNEKSKVFFWDLQRLENSGTGEDGTHNTKIPDGLPRLVREGSFASTSSSAVSGGPIASKGKKKKKTKEKELPRDRGISDPFRSIKAHKIIEIPKYQAFTHRNFASSRDGQWIVGAGDCGFITVFNRWENGVPPIKPDREVPVPEETESQINKDEILESLEALGEAYELRKQMAEDQHEPFEEDMEDMFGEYIESLPADERAFARSLARK